MRILEVMLFISLISIWFIFFGRKINWIKRTLYIISSCYRKVNNSIDSFEDYNSKILERTKKNVEIEVGKAQVDFDKTISNIRAKETKLELERIRKAKKLMDEISQEFKDSDAFMNSISIVEDVEEFEEVVLYAKEVDSCIKNFLEVRFYLTGLMHYPKLNCMDRYFSFKFPDLDEKKYTLIWQKIVATSILEHSNLKNINALYHFTNKKNLVSISNHGILTRANLDKGLFEYSFNDNLRLDDNLGSVSLSLSHPNDRMFYKYRCLTSHDDWVVIKISPSLLYGKEEYESEKIKNFQYLNKVVFCKNNAATSEMKKLTIRERMTSEAFLIMFDYPNGESSKTYTNDVQAEILYQGDIPTAFIEEIYVNKNDNNLEWIEALGFKVTKNKAVFDIRR